MLSLFYFFGSSRWARTTDKRINSPLLYQLSYRGITFFDVPYYDPSVRLKSEAVCYRFELLRSTLNTLFILIFLV